MTWLGIIRDTTPLDPRPGASELQANTKVTVDNELQRRSGFQSSSIAKQDGPILGIVSADCASGNFLTFLNGTASPSSYEATGFAPPPTPPHLPPKKRKPIVGNPQACTVWGPFSDTGQATPLTTHYVLPVGSCAGTVTMIGMEDTGRARGDDYGYSFTVDFNGVNAGASGCLVNSSSSLAIPPGTLTVDVHVTPQCVFPLGSTHGTWEVQVTSP